MTSDRSVELTGESQVRILPAAITMFRQYDEKKQITCPKCGNSAIAWGYELQVKTTNVTVCRKRGKEYIHHHE